MKKILFLICISFAFCSCGKQTNDTRCSVYDNECQWKFFQNVAKVYAFTGIPALGIPVIDPFALSNVVLSILGLLKLTLVKGEAEGIGTCVVTNFESHVEERYREVEMICKKITIRGYYTVTSAPIIGNICGWCDINGEGNGTIVLEDWAFKFVYDFRFVRREDGNIYLDPMFDTAVYEASVKKVAVKADRIRNGNRDITQKVISFINNNWKFIMNSCIGKFINDESAKYYYEIYKTYFDTSPANSFLNDNLEPLVDKVEEKYLH